VRSKPCVCSRLFVGIAGSNTAEGMEVCLLCLFCVMHVAPSATNWPFVQRRPIESVSNCV